MASAQETWKDAVSHGNYVGGVRFLDSPWEWLKDNFWAVIIIGLLAVAVIILASYLGYTITKKQTSTMLVRSKRGYMPDPGIPARKLIEVTQNYTPQKSNYAKLKGPDALMKESLK